MVYPAILAADPRVEYEQPAPVSVRGPAAVPVNSSPRSDWMTESG
jgi:hypothetical protein